MKQVQRTNRLLIADGSLLFCRGLRTVLEAEKGLTVIETASTPEEALAKVLLLKPDVLIVDVNLLSSRDDQFAVAVRQAMAYGSILALTEEDREDLLACAIAAGAKGYMLKSSNPAQLCEGIRQVASSSDGDGQQISKIMPDLNALAIRSQAKAQSPVLTSREREVVRLLAEGKTARETAIELALSVKTVEAHKLNLMRKLDVHNRADLLAYAEQNGLVPVSVMC